MKSQNNPKNVVLTGGNSGIGYETVKGLYEDGHNVIFGSRNQKLNEATWRQITKVKGGTLKYFQLDLSKRNSIQQFVKNIKENFSHIDILINNAATSLEQKIISEIGYDMIHTVNHFGPFYLTYLLFDLVTSSKEGRIINVASSGHYLVPKNDFLHDLNSEKVKYKAIDQYFRSKLLNVMFTCELKNLLLKKQISHVKTVMLNPGIVDTGLGSDSCFCCFMKLCCCCIFKNREEGAEVNLYLSRLPFSELENGQYYEENTKIKEVDERGKDPELIKELWEMSEKVYDIKFN